MSDKIIGNERLLRIKEQKTASRRLTEMTILVIRFAPLNSGLFRTLFRQMTVRLKGSQSWWTSSCAMTFSATFEKPFADVVERTSRLWRKKERKMSM